MSIQIIIRNSKSYGCSRAEQESNLRKDGYQGMNDAAFDRAKWIAKRVGYKGFIPQSIINNTDMIDGTSSKEE